MPSLSEQIFQAIQDLSEGNQRQVLNFVDFLKNKRQQAASKKVKATSQLFADAAKEVLEMGKGPGDLSTNPTYMKGDGQ